MKLGDHGDKERERERPREEHDANGFDESTRKLTPTQDDDTCGLLAVNTIRLATSIVIVVLAHNLGCAHVRGIRWSPQRVSSHPFSTEATRRRWTTVPQYNL